MLLNVSVKDAVDISNDIGITYQSLEVHLYPNIMPLASTTELYPAHRTQRITHNCDHSVQQWWWQTMQSSHTFRSKHYIVECQRTLLRSHLYSFNPKNLHSRTRIIIIIALIRYHHSKPFQIKIHVINFNSRLSLFFIQLLHSKPTLVTHGLDPKSPPRDVPSMRLETPDHCVRSVNKLRTERTD